MRDSNKTGKSLEVAANRGQRPCLIVRYIQVGEGSEQANLFGQMGKAVVGEVHEGQRAGEPPQRS